MDDTEAVRDVKVCKRSEFASKLLALGLVLARLAGVEPDVFKQGDVPVAQARHDRLSRLPHRVGGEGDRAAEDLTHPANDRSERVLVFGRALGTPEVGAHDDACARLGQGLDGWHRGSDPTVVGDIAISVERNVEIRTDEDALATQVAQVSNGLHGTNLLSSRTNAC